MGHADSRTTARYLHARPSGEDAAKLTRIFAKDMPSASGCKARSSGPRR